MMSLLMIAPAKKTLEMYNVARMLLDLIFLRGLRINVARMSFDLIQTLHGSSPENCSKVRRRLLDKLKKNGIALADPDQPGQSLTPGACVLRDMRAMNKEGDQIEFADDEDEGELNLGRMGLLRQIKHMNQVQKFTTYECIVNFRALVVVGNMRGVSGYAVSKNSSPLIAIQRGIKLAMMRFTYIDRFGNRTRF